MTETAIVRCPNCGTNNRVPRSRFARGEMPKCGKCKQSLAALLRPVTVSDNSFAAEVEHSPLPVLVDVWATWCGPCRAIAPIIDELAWELAGRVRFAKLNIDENQRTASRFRISSIPTLLIFRNGQLVDQITGAVPKSQILAQLQPWMAQ